MKNTTTRIMALAIIILLTACGNDDSTPEAMTQYFMEFAKRDNIDKKRKTSTNMQIHIKQSHQQRKQKQITYKYKQEGCSVKGAIRAQLYFEFK